MLVHLVKCNRGVDLSRQVTLSSRTSSQHPRSLRPSSRAAKHRCIAPPSVWSCCSRFPAWLLAACCCWLAAVSIDACSWSSPEQPMAHTTAGAEAGTTASLQAMLSTPCAHGRCRLVLHTDMRPNLTCMVSVSGSCSAVARYLRLWDTAIREVVTGTSCDAKKVVCRASIHMSVSSRHQFVGGVSVLHTAR
jgi:hypothetical protein